MATTRRRRDSVFSLGVSVEGESALFLKPTFSITSTGEGIGVEVRAKPQEAAPIPPRGSEAPLESGMNR